MALPPGFTMCVFSGLVFGASFGQCNFVMKQPPPLGNNSEMISLRETFHLPFHFLSSIPEP